MKRLAAKNKTMDLRDPKVREEFLMSEVMKANQKMAEGEKMQQRYMYLYTEEDFNRSRMTSLCSYPVRFL